MGPFGSVAVTRQRMEIRRAQGGRYRRKRHCHAVPARSAVEGKDLILANTSPIQPASINPRPVHSAVLFGSRRSSGSPRNTSEAAH
jgi:hypothetical protein